MSNSSVEDYLDCRLKTVATTQSRNNFWKSFVGVLFMTLYMLVASGSTGYSKYILSKATIGKEIREFFLHNHLQYIFVCMMIWMSLFYNLLYLLYI